VTDSRRPNVLFFFTDDQRFSAVGALGQERLVTPNMDRLVTDGTTFAQAHIMGGSCAAVCMPSRAMLMTGRTLFHLDGQGQRIPQDHTMLPELLRRHGYQTFGTGKWHNGPPSYARCFTDGDRIFFGGMSDHFAVPLNHYDRRGKYPHDSVYYQRGRHSSDLFAEAAIDFLYHRDEERPFFCYVSFTAPHDPRDTHPRYHAMYDADRIPLPPNFAPQHPFDNGELGVRDELLAPIPRPPEEIRQHIADYYAMITHADAEMGRVLEALRDIGEMENTVIVFAGDNGLALGQHGLMGKQNMYEHSIRVPLIISGPDLPRNARSEAFCYLQDIYPTLCDLLGIDVPNTVEGISLLPALSNPQESLRDTMLFAYRGIQRAVKDRRHKLIEYVVDGERTTQLFDLLSDPWETENLATDPASEPVLSRLRSELLRWQTELDDDAQGFWEAYQAATPSPEENE